MFGIGTTELLVIGLIALVFFGGKRLPEIGQGLGKAISEFRKINKGDKGESKKEQDQVASEEKKTEPKGFIEKAITDKIVDAVPGVKQARDLKDKADKIKSFVG
ncbi:MAG: twin-arginine translocase TatA/TatE family subunit [Patescibacteria group bacterium]|nr:twin-arginine translocase TatA/TatE family subunit [Patescibacteria group bacterium]